MDGIFMTPMILLAFLWPLVLFIIAVIVYSLVLHLTTKLLGFYNQNIRIAIEVILSTALISLVAGFVYNLIIGPIILTIIYTITHIQSLAYAIYIMIAILLGPAIFIYFIKEKYLEGWKNSILAWLITTVVGIILFSAIIVLGLFSLSSII